MRPISAGKTVPILARLAAAPAWAQPDRIGSLVDASRMVAVRESVSPLARHPYPGHTVMPLFGSANQQRLRIAVRK